MNMRATMYGFLALAIFVLDRMTKAWALIACTIPQIVNDYLVCDLTMNRGISWGFFQVYSTLSTLFLITLLLAIILFFVRYAYKKYCAGHAVVGEVMVVSGALSNVVDRFYYNGVIDFILVHYHEWIWPTFNVADIAIVVGVGIMLVLRQNE